MILDKRNYASQEERSMFQRLGIENVLSNGLLPPISPTDIANFEVTSNAPKDMPNLKELEGKNSMED